MATNSFVTVKELARGILPRLIENLVFPGLIHKDYSSTFTAEKGDTIQVRKPVVFTAAEFDQSSGVTAQDVKQETVDVKLDHLATVDFEFTAIQKAVNTGSLDPYIEAAAVALAEKINSDGLELYKDIPYMVGTAGTTPDGLDDFANAAKVLNKAKVPTTGRKGVWNPDANAAFQQLPALVNAEKSGSTEALREGAIGRVFGVDNYMAQGVKNHTTGGAGTILIDKSGGFAAGDTELHVDGASAALKVGDIITIANVAGSYVVTEAGTLSTADQDITVYPGLAGSAANDAAVTVVASHAANLVFHENAFAFVTRPLAAPAGVESYTTSYNGISLRVTRGYDMQYKKEMISVDVLYGYKTMYPEMACVVLG